MRLLEDLSSIPLNQTQTIIQQVSTPFGVAPPPPPSIPPKGPQTAKRVYGGQSLKLELLLDVKERLLKSKSYIEKDGELIVLNKSKLSEAEKKQIKLDIEDIKSKLEKIKGMKD